MVFPRFGSLSKPVGEQRDAEGRTMGIGRAKPKTVCPFELGIKIESPPCVLYGSALESTGALLNGLLILDVKKKAELTGTDWHGLKLSSRLGSYSMSKSRAGGKAPVRQHSAVGGSAYSPVDETEEGVYLTGLKLRMIQHVRYGKPFVPNSHVIASCGSCKKRDTDLAKWDVLKAAKWVASGQHSYPFSYLVPGHISSTCSLGSGGGTKISYELLAEASYRYKGADVEGKDEHIVLSVPVAVTRSILRGPEKNSLRVFPPTDVVAAALLPNVIYPTSTFPLELRLDGVCSEGRKWRMRRLTWRIDEKVRVKSHACPLHMSKLKVLEDEVKEKQARNAKKPIRPIKRTPDMGPQVTVAAHTPENPAFEISQNTGRRDSNNANLYDQTTSSAASNVFVHPSDHAMQQELHEQNERLRRQQLEEEQKQETTIYTEEIRTLASEDINSGWKSDFSETGKIELVIDVDCTKLHSGVSNPVNYVSTARPFVPPPSHPANVACDIEDHALGIFVSHLLSVEIIVAEEVLQYSNGQPINESPHVHPGAAEKVSTGTSTNSDHRLAELSPMFANRNHNSQRRVSETGFTDEIGTATQTPLSSRIVGVPTGAARVLRMQFRLVMTERSGIGISWDDEVPPTYQAVKHLSPPGYYDIPVKQLSTPSNTHTLHDVSIDSAGSVSGSQTSIELSKLTLSPSVSNPHINGSDPISLSIEDSRVDSGENIMVIQGNVFGESSTLTPHPTRNIRVVNMSELLDTNRITQ
ncbi:HBL210Wp [Eremothecium sinecaudum]|uniref:HBL210Wp n=1 Tax=Eremothecium sinecaudum TaxID=45286 RepID=A0A120K0U4_9SACH|nr:HBL210Wp [Eremothecium sinecaudum]AMD18692.1 HBL210Wp [Eremothecium sinecaudum]